MKIHELKTWPIAFSGLKAGLKTHDVRKWDREFEIGDVLKLREFDPELDREDNAGRVNPYSGEFVWREIVWISDPSTYGMSVEFIVMSVRPCHAPMYPDDEGPDVPHDHRD